VILFFYRRPGNKLAATSRRGMKHKPHELRSAMTDYRGNRLTVNGIVMLPKKMTRVFRIGGGGQLVGVFDLELTGDSAVEYGVTRQRLDSRTNSEMRSELRRAIAAGLRDLGVAERLTQQYQVNERTSDRDIRYISDEKLLQDVKQLIPETTWLIGLHREIAEKLSIRPTLAHQAITTLLARGEITKPARAEACAADRPSTDWRS
jgi:hypothetical protein